MIPYERKLIIILSIISILLLIVDSYFHLKREVHLKLIPPAGQSAK